MKTKSLRPPQVTPADVGKKGLIKKEDRTEQEVDIVLVRSNMCLVRLANGVVVPKHSRNVEVVN